MTSGIRRCLVTYHPLSLRDPRPEKESWKDLEMAMKIWGYEAEAAKIHASSEASGYMGLWLCSIP